ncbi:MAG TPA: SpoIID/LytB domain-containing protein [Bacillota bacterium]|jgi:stage II sporulation protein D|nr:SpoIID/LytB domain-containing protein [Bacillota bacterium]HPT67928.1 SpoIID/LytB domain-containing protein [Bacillota bacterium]
MSKTIRRKRRTLHLKAFWVLLLLTAFLVPHATAEFLPTEGLNTAVALYYQGKFEESLERLRSLARSSPGDVQIQLNYIRLLREVGRYDEALPVLGRLVANHPKHTGYRLAMVSAVYLGGYYDRVIQLTTADDDAAILFWRGLALAESGKTAAAIKTLEDSIAKEPFNPSAHFHLGRLYAQTGDLTKADLHYRKTLTQDANWSAVFFPLSQVNLALGKPQTAFDLLTKAKNVFPADPRLAPAMAKLTSAYPGIGQKPTEALADPAKIVPPTVAALAKNREKIPEIRIGLAEKVKEVIIKTGGPYLLAAADTTPVLEGSAGHLLRFRLGPEGMTVTVNNGVELLKTGQPLTLVYKKPEHTTVIFNLDFGQGWYWAGRENRAYRGALEFLPRKDGLTIVNRLNIEEYLYSVVPSEMSAKWPAAALCAQAVAARTYTWANLGRFASRGFDLLASVVSQAYNGVKAESPAAHAAVDSTRGLILTYDGKPIGAFFSANSGGYSEDSENLWRFTAPYLKANPDPKLTFRMPLPPEDLADWLTKCPRTASSHPDYSARSAYRWTYWLSRQELEARLGLGDKLGAIKELRTAGRGASGRVRTVLIRGDKGEHRLSGEAIRRTLGGLRSTLFTVEPKLGKDGRPEYFIFTGGGWGHGIGLDQSGAAGLAAEGWDFRQILSHYYPGAILESIY